MTFRFDEHDTGAVRLHLAMAGSPDKPLLICLHGFPEFWGAWGEVMERLADDFFIVAPDQRGFNQSSKPEGVDAYRVKHMVADLKSLADRFSPDRPFVLAGHDWGASVAYAYAFAHPARLSHLVIANGVHPVCFQRAIFEDEEQRRASQYINRLKAADAEDLLSADGYRRLLRMIDGFSTADFMTGEMRGAYFDAWSCDGALTAMLNWYRASPIAVPAPGETAPPSLVLDMPADAFKVAMPHLVIWGDADQALRPACLKGLDGFASQLTVETVTGAGHWILHERPDEVAAAMRRFLHRA
jgi:pimeloyl-ACP methyl ester carboxylesterase